MRLREFQKKWDEACERLIAAGKMVPRGELKHSVEENTSEDKQVTIGAIFMPPRINRREKWLKDREKRLKDEENNNDNE
jgi:hypothetical protein